MDSKYDNIKITIQFGNSISSNYKKAIRLCKQFPHHNLIEYGNEVNECSLVSLDEYCQYNNMLYPLFSYIHNWKSTRFFIDDVTVSERGLEGIRDDIVNRLRNSKNKKNMFRYKVLCRQIVLENLPYPIVYYPPKNGVFLAFAQDEKLELTICKCNEKAIENYIRIKRKEKDFRFSIKEDFPQPISKAISFKKNFINDLVFKEKLCHRCNLSSVSKVGITSFREIYSEYIKINYFKFGIYRTGNRFVFLPDICPDDLKEAAILHNKYIQQFDEVYEDEVRNQGTQTFLFTDELKHLSKLYCEQVNYIDNVIENHTRQEFGLRKTEDRWINETILYQIVAKIFKDEKILRHHRPDWLDGLELDIYIPRLNIAFEYQGQQHFHPIKAWGGVAALKALQERDERKLRICTSLNIKLYIIDYREPLTQEYIQDLIGQL